MSTLRTKRTVSALAALTLAVGGIGAVQVLSEHAPAAYAASCPAPTTDISSQMTIGQPELVNDDGNATTELTVGQTLGYKVKWSTKSKVTAGQYFTYKLSTKSANPIAPFTFDVKSASGTVIGCATWGADGNVKVVFNEAAEGAASWDGWVVTRSRLTLDANKVGGTQPFHLTETKSVDVNVKKGVGVGDGFRKDGFWTYPGTVYNKSRTLSWRVTIPGGSDGMKNVTFTDNSEDTKWDFDCADLTSQLKTNASNFKLLAAVGGGNYAGADLSNGALRENATITCEANALKIQIPEIPANQFAVFTLYGRVENLVNGRYWNTANIEAPGTPGASIASEKLVYGADAAAEAKQVFSISKKVDDSAAALADDPEFSFEVTLKGPGVDKTETVTVKKGQTYTYPDKLPVGTKVTIKEKNLPDASVLWDNATSGVFTEAEGITLGADKKTATLTVNPEKDYTATVTNVTKPKPTPTPSTTTPTPSPTPSTTTPPPTPPPPTPTPAPTPPTTTPPPTPTTPTPAPTPSTTTPAPTPSTTTPAPTPSESTTTPVPPAPSTEVPPAVPSESPKKPKNPKSSLAKTGADSGVLLGAGLAALLAGAAAIATRRKMG